MHNEQPKFYTSRMRPCFFDAMFYAYTQTFHCTVYTIMTCSPHMRVEERASHASDKVRMLKVLTHFGKQEIAIYEENTHTQMFCTS